MSVAATIRNETAAGRRALKRLTWTIAIVAAAGTAIFGGLAAANHPHESEGSNTQSFDHNDGGIDGFGEATAPTSAGGPVAVSGAS